MHAAAPESVLQPSPGVHKVRVRNSIYGPAAYTLVETPHFSKKEIKKLKLQFKRIATNGKLDIEGFRKSMGVLGMVQDSLLCQRLFSVFNKSKTNEIDFEEFAMGLGVLIKGSVDEKLDFAFGMTDIDGSGYITYEELLLTVQSIMRIYSGIMGTSSIATLDALKVQKLFNKLDRDRDGKISKAEYKRGMRRHPELVASLRGSNVFQSGQYRTTELLRKRIRKYQRNSIALEKSIQQVIDLLKSSNKDVEDPPTLLRSATIMSDATITDDESDDSSVDAAPEEEKPEEVDLLELLSQMQAKLKEMSVSDYGTIEYARRKHSERFNGSKQRPVNLEFMNGGSSTTPDLCHFASETEGEENQSPNPDSDNENMLQRYIAPAAKGSTVFFGHKNWDLVLNVMKGIQLTVSRCYAESREINSCDYAFKEKYTLIAGAKQGTSSAKISNDIDLDTSGRSCRFIDYAPFVFQNLREHFGIRNEDYVHSIGPGNMLSNLMLGSLSSLSELGSEGKSGSFFYFTSDGKYMVKTVSNEEHKLLRSILPEYHKHMIGKEANSSTPLPTLLCRFVGCHVIRLSKHSKIGANKIYFVVMVNMLKTDLELHRRYDLKGSWVGRSSSAVDRGNSKKTLKDTDFIEMNQKIAIGAEKKKKLMAMLERDSKFLEEQGIIDYSVILGVHEHKQGLRPTNTLASMTSFTTSNSGEDDSFSNVNKQIPWYQEDNGGILSSDKKATYILGIIDILTIYGSKKKAERFGKTVLFMDRGGISVMPPHGYRKRFLSFFDKHVE